MSRKIDYTQSQKEVISFRGKDMLVSASAGTGKTTVMIERIASLIEEGVDVNEIVVVTFTNLAAAEMKARLATRLAKKRDNPRVFRQLEKLDTASICTLHSFCSELLRNYFYVVDIDPAFAILDDATVATLKRNALDELFAEYFSKDDDAFKRVYKIFSTNRKEDNFRQTLMRLYGFSRCLENFDEWYRAHRENFLNLSDTNVVVRTLLDDIAQMVKYVHSILLRLADNSRESNFAYTDSLEKSAERVAAIRLDNLENAVLDLGKFRFANMPNRAGQDLDEVERELLGRYATLKKVFGNFKEKYVSLFRGEKTATQYFHCESLSTLWKETQATVHDVDKLVELVARFDELYFEEKKQRGGVDYDDLEHLCLQVLSDEATRQEIHSRYKLIFVDEYQDTNPIQEAIIKALSTPDNLFMVGDVKQSIYGFRGCEPSIFVDKYEHYKATQSGQVVELNDNFRSNKQILEFVNAVFDRVMTASFGKVDYKGTAELHGTNPPTLSAPSTQVDVVVKKEVEKSEIFELYDIRKDKQIGDEVTQGEIIAARIKEYVGKAYVGENGEPKRIDYGDIVILMRGMTERATDIYNTLVSKNIPVTANFKIDGLSTKEVRDVVNLFRAIDNPYNDVALVGACLSPFGRFSEAELGLIRLDTDGIVPFYERLQQYIEKGLNAETVSKIREFLDLLDALRFYSRSASVDEVALEVLQRTNYHLYVQGLPNGALRIKKLYAFIDGVKGAAYAQSVDKFLSFVDETESNRAEEGLTQTNAVRIMTMHASKGLEFPVVFVAGVETEILFDRVSVERNVDLGVAIRYYDFDNMTKSDTLGFYACKLLNHNKQREEEMRLLYVAMTRAKFVLNLVVTLTEEELNAYPKLPSLARSHADWLLPAITDLHVSQRAAAIMNLDKHVALPKAQADKKEQLLCKQLTDNDVPAIEAKLGYVYGYINETQMPSKIVSSALDKEYVDSASADDEPPQPDYVLSADSDRNFVGTAYHKLYQYLPLQPTLEQIAHTLNELVNSGKIEQRFAEQIDAQLVYDTLHSPQLLRLLEGGKVYHEIPFMLSVPFNEVAEGERFTDEVMLQGVIDLLVLREDSAVVIDFKYTSRSDNVKERYKAQLNSYRIAVERICGITDVETYVLSIADNKLIKFS